MKKYLGNAFSLQMMDLSASTDVRISPILPAEVPADVISCIGHPDTASVVSGILGMDVPCQRISVHLTKGDVLYVAQLVGGRLPEGSTTLPDGFDIKFLRVTIL